MPSPISSTSYQNANLNSREFQARIEQIRGDGMLSDQGKLGEIKAEYDRALATKAKIDADRVKQLEARRSSIEQNRLWLRPSEAANSSTVIAFRDSQQRADTLKDEAEALRSLERSERSGDNLHARAILAAAFEPDRMWINVVDAYVAKHPETEADLHELWAMVKEDGSGNGPLDTDTFAQLLATPTDVRLPRELGGRF
ncbi:hypothetical protein [Frigoribacterium sp. ME-P-080]|uniref:hypothetical protein n=1 Tax=Frigoribacterium sp. ME-P-080 TaxID=3040289 RepID=UPI00254F037A|nr:hypothetical protein [Frigoribacterium sp. ME-P-080]